MSGWSTNIWFKTHSPYLWGASLFLPDLRGWTNSSDWFLILSTELGWPTLPVDSAWKLLSVPTFDWLLSTFTEGLLRNVFNEPWDESLIKCADPSTLPLLELVLEFIETLFLLWGGTNNTRDKQHWWFTWIRITIRLWRRSWNRDCFGRHFFFLFRFTYWSVCTYFRYVTDEFIKRVPRNKRTVWDKNIHKCTITDTECKLTKRRQYIILLNVDYSSTKPAQLNMTQAFLSATLKSMKTHDTAN